MSFSPARDVEIFESNHSESPDDYERLPSLFYGRAFEVFAMSIL